MQFTALDWSILVAFFALSLGIGAVAARRASQGFAAFFLGNRAMPWWLLGVSMVATTFATDTPNLVADIVRSDGVVGNWVWWAFLLTGMLTVFFYARLWRRSEVLTDIEFYELRYSGKPAAFLRGFRAVYLGVVFNTIIMANVTLAAIKIGGVMMQWTPLETVLIAASVTMVYSALGGLTGVLITDFLQFGLAMVGAIAAAYVAVNLPEVGGLAGLVSHPNVAPATAFLPDFSTMGWDVLVPIFVIPLAVQWWASYYPGAEPGGGGHMAQRMLAAKDERHATGAALLFNALFIALRPWPWILVALASLVVFPDLASLRAAFPHLAENVVQNDLAYPAMLTYLPAGLLGVAVTSLAAAYMSTMSTQVNWGASVLVNDVYRRFLAPTASDRQQVWVGRLATVGLMVLASALALLLESALQGFNLLLQIGAGTGLLMLLRWFWWRVNAAAEITGMVVSFAVAALLFVNDGFGMAGWQQFLLIVGVTTAAWVVVMLVTPPTEASTLRTFYAKVRPLGPGWHLVRRRAEADGQPLPAPPKSDATAALAGFLAAVVGVYTLLFATGFFLYGDTAKGVVCAALAAGAIIVLLRVWPRLSWG
ncbi:MAG: sodium:solute symporter family protein [Bacteroidota bacterium]